MPNYPVTTETRQKMSQTAKVSWENPDIKAARLAQMAEARRLNPPKRKPRTEETKARIRAGKLAHADKVGRKNPREPKPEPRKPGRHLWRIINGQFVDMLDEKNISGNSNTGT